MFYEERAEERAEVVPGTKMGVRMWGTAEQRRPEEGGGAVASDLQGEKILKICFTTRSVKFTF